MSTAPQGNPLAVVTGASSGIGFELAKQFAQNGFDVTIVAEDAELEQAARELTALGVGVDTVRADLTKPEEVDRVADHLIASDRPVAALALNAGRGAGGAFASGEDQNSLADELAIVDLNVRSTVHLAKRVIPRMVAHGEGRVLITSSIASTMPGAYQAVYNASKSFDQSFAEAIRQELKDTGVTVTSLMPGPTDTEFFDKGDLRDTKLGAEGSPKDSPEQVARDGFEALMAGKEKVVAGNLLNKVQAQAGALIPDGVKAKLHAAMAKPGSAK